MHFALGNTYRGLLAAALIADGGSLLSAWNGTITWHESITAVATSIIFLAAALIDPGSKPPKDAVA